MRQGLTRYDTVQLRPISRMENPNIPVIPRISMPGDPYLHDLSTMNQRSPIHSMGLQPLTIHSPAVPPRGTSNLQSSLNQELLVNPEPESDWSELLHEIQEIGLSRFLYILKKYPGIVLIIIGAWTLWGRGWSTDILKDVEQNLGIIGIVTGAIATAGVVFLSQHHSNDKNAAKSQTTIRIVISAINAILAIVVIVFGVITISNVHGESEQSVPNLPALSINERTAHAGAMVGVGLLMAVFALMSIFFGWQGILKVNKNERNIKRSKDRQQAAYSNPGVWPYGNF